MQLVQHRAVISARACTLNLTQCDGVGNATDAVYVDRLYRMDYKGMMYNSTFCLVPHGKRLGSFRYNNS